MGEDAATGFGKGNNAVGLDDILFLVPGAMGMKAMIVVVVIVVLVWWWGQ